MFWTLEVIYIGLCVLQSLLTFYKDYKKPKLL